VVSGEQDAPALFDHGQTERRREVGLSSARWPEAQQIGSLFEPGVTVGQRLHLGLRDHRHGGEVERVERLSRRQPGFLQMTSESSPASFHHFLFGESRQETSGGTAFLVSRRRQRGPDQHQLDARQSQLVLVQGKYVY